MLIEIHVIKNYSPSNLNRDDTGSPKNCLFGDYFRGRISSQCQKRHFRIDLKNNKVIREKNIDFGLRTRRLPFIVAERLENDFDEETLEKIKAVLSAFGNKNNKPNDDTNITSQIAFYSEKDIEFICTKVKELIDSIKTITKESNGELKHKDIKEVAGDIEKKLKNIRPITLDIALSGRMMTSQAFQDIDASMQVAHAISTNKMENEFDFYTAVDDLLEKSEDTGAGNMGDIEFNSNCYYLYANIDTDQLEENLKLGDVPEEEVKTIIKNALPEIIKTFTMVTPSGKQNSFAAHNPPSMIYVELKEEKVPINLANAFVKPAFASKKMDLIESSIYKFVKYTNDFKMKFDEVKAVSSYWFTQTDYESLEQPEESIKCNSFSELGKKIASGIR